MARVARSIARTALPRLNPSRIANPSPRSNAASFVPRAFGNGASPSFRLSLRPASRPLRLRGEIAFLESLLPYHSAVSNACFVSRLRSGAHNNVLMSSVEVESPLLRSLRMASE
eukprot:c19411_g1_i3 orf=529-870(-)